MWVALKATYYTGGTSRVDNVYNDDRTSNARMGITGVIPLAKRSAIKLSASTGAIVRAGQDFTTFSIGYQTSWIKKTVTEKQE